MISPFDHPWLGSLFGDAEIGAAWSPERQLAHYLSFEAALARGLGLVGLVDTAVSERAATAIRAAQPDTGGLAAGTVVDGVCIPSLVAQLRDSAGVDSEAVHTGATSQDVLDTALALTLKEVNAVLSMRLSAVSSALTTLSATFGGETIMGRTRMQAALSIKARDRIAVWSAPLPEYIKRLDLLRDDVEVLQLGGPVGTRQDWGDKADALSEYMCKTLGLKAPQGIWHSDRRRLADYASGLSLISGSLGKMGQDIALMAQQGIGEIRLSGGGASSAMPHKANPVLAELLVTLARFNAAQLSAMHSAMVHEQERSGAAWLLEWMVLPAMTMATGRGLAAALELIDRIEHIGTGQ